MASSFIEVCHEVVSWVRTPKRPPNLSAKGIGHVHLGAHPVHHLHPVPNMVGAPSSNPSPIHLHHIGHRLRHAGMTKVVALVCVVTGGVAAAGLVVDKAAQLFSEVGATAPAPTPIPEPSTLYLLAFGVSALFYCLHLLHKHI